MHLRTAALFTFLASLGALSPALWDGVDRIARLAAANSQWWILPLLPFIAGFSAIMPLFYYALYRDKAPVIIPRALRKLALAAAIGFVLVVVLRLRVLNDPLNWRFMLNHAADVTYLVLLVMMSRDTPGGPATEDQPSDLLRKVTKLAVIVWCVAVAFLLLRIPYIALTYGLMVRVAFQVGRTAPPLSEMLLDAALTLLLQASFLAAPFIVWRSGWRRMAGTVSS